MNKKVLKGIIAGLIFTSGISCAYAAGIRHEIKATLDSQITIIYNNETQKLKDTNGNTLSPIMYNGMAYVPIRSISNILGANVNWDDASKSIILTDSINIDIKKEPLDKIMGEIYSGVNSDLPLISNNWIANDIIKGNLGINKLDCTEAYMSKSISDSTPHSVVLMRVPETTDIEELKTEIKKSIDPKKWNCASIDKKDVIVESNGRLIIMIIDKTLSQEIQNSFLRL